MTGKRAGGTAVRFSHSGERGTFHRATGTVAWGGAAFQIEAARPGLRAAIDAACKREDAKAARQRYSLYGRSFAIVAEFKDCEEGTREANAFMEANPGASVLAVEDGRVILADKGDQGQPLAYQFYRLTWADGITRDVWAADEAEARKRGAELMEQEAFDHGDLLLVIATGER